MLRKPTDGCRTSMAAVSGLKTSAERELTCWGAAFQYGGSHTRIDYFACGMFYMFRLIIVSYCELYRRLRLLAFVNIADGSFI